MESALERLVAAAGYPEAVPAGAHSFTLQVDGGEVFAEEGGGRIRLARRLADDVSEWPLLAACAPGRMLREDATPAVGAVPGDRDGKKACFLWQDAPAGTDAHGLLRLLETFLDSCDWWRARSVGREDACRECGYLGYLELEQILALKPSAIREGMRYLG